MPENSARERLLQAAERATYRHGFRNTALADIAKEARVPLGNVYYYFKTKDEIGGAIVELRVSRFKKLLQKLDKATSPKERLCGFVDIKIKNRKALARGGCPVGTLCSELQKYGGSAANKSVVQFAEIGKAADSRGLAIHLLSATQGVSVLAHAFHDPTLIATEAQRLKEWIRAL